MSDIRFQCSKCGQSLKAAPDMAGQEVECPHCSTAGIVPEGESEKAVLSDVQPRMLESLHFLEEKMMRIDGQLTSLKTMGFDILEVQKKQAAHVKSLLSILQVFLFFFILSMLASCMNMSLRGFR